MLKSIQSCATHTHFKISHAEVYHVYKIYTITVSIVSLIEVSHSVVEIVEVDFLWNRTVDSLKMNLQCIYSSVPEKINFYNCKLILHGHMPYMYYLYYNYYFILHAYCTF